MSIEQDSVAAQYESLTFNVKNDERLSHSLRACVISPMRRADCVAMLLVTLDAPNDVSGVAHICKSSIGMYQERIEGLKRAMRRLATENEKKEEFPRFQKSRDHWRFKCPRYRITPMS